MEEKQYDEVYKEADGEAPWTFPDIQETVSIMQFVDNWQGLNVLDFGCGTGDLVNLLTVAGAKVTGIDKSKTAIGQAKEKYPLLKDSFFCDDKPGMNSYDVIVMKGVLEHLSNPFEFLNDIFKRNFGMFGTVISSSPGWTNLRGYILMTIKYLFDLDVTRVKEIEIFPEDINLFCLERGYKAEVATTEQDWGAGSKMIKDLEQRLPKIFKDTTLDEIQRKRMRNLLEFAKKAEKYSEYHINSGAVMVYKMTKIEKVKPKRPTSIIMSPKGPAGVGSVKVH